MVSVMRQVAAFFAHQLIMQTAIGDVATTMVRTDLPAARAYRVLLVRLLLLSLVAFVKLARMRRHVVLVLLLLGGVVL